MIRIKSDLLFLFLCAFFVIFCSEKVIAQSQITAKEIKVSGKYKFGDGFAGELDVARDNAKRNLVLGISAYISTETELIEQESGSNYISDYRSNVTVESEMNIEGLRYHEEKRRDGTWRVIAYVSNEDFENMIENIRRRMFLKLENALHYENINNYNRAIALFYEIFAETPSLPVKLFTDSEKHGAELELQQYARERLVQWLDAIEINVEGVRDGSGGDNVELYIDLSFYYRGQPVEYLNVNLNRPGYGAIRVENGKAELFYDLPPEEKLEDVNIRLEVNPPQLMISDEMRNKANNLSPKRNKSILVDFTDVIKLDFEIDSLGENQYLFIPMPINLSVTNVDWNFGDGSRSTDLQPTHTYVNMRHPRRVTLRFNRSPELEVTKTIKSSGDILRVENPRYAIRARPLNKGYFVPFHQREYIKRLAGMKNYEALQSYIDRLRDGNIITNFGARTAVRAENCYILITNPDTELVEAVLSPVRSNARYDIISDQFLRFDKDRWVESFRGYRPIYVEF